MENNIIKTSLFLVIAFLLYTISKIFHIAPNIIPLLLPIFIPLLNNLYYSIIFTVGFFFLNLLIGLHIQVLPLIILFFIPLIAFYYSKKHIYYILISAISLITFLIFFSFLIPQYLLNNKLFYFLAIIAYIIGINIYNIVIIELSIRVNNYIDREW
jgi:hypothetical protein